MKNQSRLSKIRKIALAPVLSLMWMIGWTCYNVKGKVKVEEEPVKPKGYLSFKVKKTIDLLLPNILAIIAVSWLCLAIGNIMVDRSFFSATTLYPLNLTMHSLTVVSLTLLFIVNILFYRTFLPGHLRALRACLFTVVGIFFYDFVWSSFNFIINGTGSLFVPLLSFLVVVAFMYFIDKKQTRILRFKVEFFAIVFLVYVVSLLVFVLSGFFVEWGLYEAGLANDPTGFVWFVNKTVALWMWMVFALR